MEILESTEELANKIINAKTAEEIVKLAKENNLDIEIDEANKLREKIFSRELSDEDLDKITGGGNNCRFITVIDSKTGEKKIRIVCK